MLIIAIRTGWSLDNQVVNFIENKTVIVFSKIKASSTFHYDGCCDVIHANLPDYCTLTADISGLYGKKSFT